MKMLIRVSYDMVSVKESKLTKAQAALLAKKLAEQVAIQMKSDVFDVTNIHTAIILDDEVEDPRKPHVC